jgi:hypothetical protein
VAKGDCCNHFSTHQPAQRFGAARRRKDAEIRRVQLFFAVLGVLSVSLTRHPAMREKTAQLSTTRYFAASGARREIARHHHHAHPGHRAEMIVRRFYLHY